MAIGDWVPQLEPCMTKGDGRETTEVGPGKPLLNERRVVDRRQPAQSGIPTDAKARKGAPVFSGVIKYFPDALVAVAELSRVGNDQHNPGQPLHWAKEKSTDEPDALLRHLIDRARGDAFDTDGVRHLAKAAWRALAALQREIDAEQSSSKGSPTPTEVGTIIRSTEASAETAGRPLGRPE